MAARPTPPLPGLPAQAGARTALRVGGAVLLLLGVAVFGYGLVSVFGSMDSFDPPRGGQIAAFIGGLPLIGVGLGMLNAGFLGAQARYVAGETAPVLRDTAAYLSDGEGVLGIGRTVDDGSPAPGAAASGPFCRSCGVRNDDDARFCDSCGTSLA